MKTYLDLKHILPSESVVALGCFDGVHIGHAGVIRTAADIAREKNISLCVFTFSDIPKNAFLAKPLPLICDKEEKKKLMRALSADYLLMPDFTDSIMHMSPEDFFYDVLVSVCRAKHIVCGFNYSFGAKGAGNTALLKKLCLQNNTALTVVDPVISPDISAPVSSTAVREAVEAGDTERAERMLGRRFSLTSEWEPSPGSHGIRQYFKAGTLVPKAGVYESVSDGRKTVTRVFYADGRYCAQTLLPGALPRAKRVKTEFVKPEKGI